MATYRAVAAVGRSIVGLLEGATRPAEFADAKFRLFRTEDFDNPVETGLSVYLYRIAADSSTRNLPSVDRGGGRKTRPLPVVLHYLLTPWGDNAASEHQLLAWAMRVLEETPLLSSALLNAACAGTFSGNEAVEVILNDGSPGEAPMDAASLWRALGSRYRLGVSYIARRVMIDSPADDTDGSG